MATPESIHRLLSVAAALLNEAAAEIRDARLAPANENIERIGSALTDIFDIQQQVYRVRPDLMPESIARPTGQASANRLLTEYLYKAIELERAGNTHGAIATFEEFLALESSADHRDIAIGEINRIRAATVS
jgi:hypothetical protein